VSYQGKPLTSAVDAAVLLVVGAAREGRLVVFAGAGLSMADDAGLPSGRRLGELLDERLVARLLGYVSPPDTADLLAVADAAVVAAGGVAPLQQEVLQLADFDRATPNYGHRAVALLLAEGAFRSLLLWNWDNCVERSALEGERLEVARTREDVVQLRVPAIAKIHGCITRMPTLLITSDQLKEPPLWADEAFKAALRGATGVFIGIGDVADYAKRRLTELRTEFPSPDVYVVSPSIVADWTGSVWSTLMPGLDLARRVPKTADEFLDELTRAWAIALPDSVEAAAAGLLTQAVVDGIDRTLEAFRACCGVEVVAWARRTTFRQGAGESAIRLPATQEAVSALGVLAGERAAASVTVLPDARVQLDSAPIEVLVACGTVAATQIEAEARRRAERLAGRRLVDDAAEFLVSGVVIGAFGDPDEVDLLEGRVDVADVFVGPRGVRLTFTRAAEVVARAA
jgi:hypothetical protein